MVQTRSSRYWDKRAIARLTEAERNSEWHFREIKILYEEAEKDTVASLKAIYESFYRENKFDMTALNKIVPTAEVEKFYADMEAAGLSKYLPKRFQGRIKRLEMINAQLWSRTKQLTILENEIEAKSHIETINGAFGKTIYDTAKGIGATPAFEQLNSRGIEVLLNTPWQGANYSKRIWGNSNALAGQLQQTLTKAIMTGMSEERALYEIRQRFNVGSFYAERLIRTETNHFENETEFIAYQEMSIDKYVFVATLDGRTSDMCRGYIGKDYEPKMRAARNKLGGKYFVPNMSYNDWIKDVGYNPNIHPADVPTIMS